jgi:hypothetical protein
MVALYVSKAGQHYRRLVRKLCYQAKITAHRKQEITSLLKPRNTILTNTKLSGHADLRTVVGFTQLGNAISSAISCWARTSIFLLRLLPFFGIRDRWLSCSRYARFNYDIWGCSVRLRVMMLEKIVMSMSS